MEINLGTLKSAGASDIMIKNFTIAYGNDSVKFFIDGDADKYYNFFDWDWLARNFLNGEHRKQYNKEIIPFLGAYLSTVDFDPRHKFSVSVNAVVNEQHYAALDNGGAGFNLVKANAFITEYNLQQYKADLEFRKNKRKKK